MKKTKKASAILTSDIHIRHDIPICRTDNFFEAMERKIDFIIDLSKKNDCPILSAGDLGHKPQWKNWMLEWTINKFKETYVVICAGQHDLPGHRLSEWDKSGIGVLHAAQAIEFIQEPILMSVYGFEIHPFSYGQEITPPEKSDFPKVAMTHQMIVEKGDLFPGQNGYRGNKVLSDNPDYDLILSGDNHSPFVAECNGRKLVNPGSMMRTTAAQKDHKPRVYLWYADTNEIEKVYIPIEKNVVSSDHIKVKDERSDRYDSFVKKLKEETELDLSFEHNIENYFKKYRTEIAVKNKVFLMMENGEK